MRSGWKSTVFLLLLMLPAAGLCVTLEQLSLEEMIEASTYIVRGRVGPTLGVSGATMLYTEYELQVTEVLSGDPGGMRLRLALPGGRLGGREQVFSGVPVPIRGKEYVFFLWRGRSGMLQLVGMTQGLLEVRRAAGLATAERAPSDGMVLNRRSGLPVHDQGMRVSLARLRTSVAAARERRGGPR
ncbi:MAG: hypothetical protein KIT83_16455 [Bryobacterales bacterium]|nr:hypothetical protein [Bryobacterales bacterium]